MKKIISALIFGVLSAFTLFAQPKNTIVFENNIYDFGTIQIAEKPYTKTFTFTNAGLLPLQVQIVTTPCSCTSVTWTKEELQPGEKGEITVSLHTTVATDDLSFTFYVYSNGIPNPAAVKITAKVTEPKKKSR